MKGAVVRTTVIVLALGLAAAGGSRQASGQIFPSQDAANLPTTATLPAGNLLFEVSHRFGPPISDGVEALWGLDGPVVNRLGLAYAVSERAMLGILRSNLEDNLELNAKMRLLEADLGSSPLHLGAKAGYAWNTSPTLAEGAEDNESQLYVQGIVNLGLGNIFAIGIVPTYLRNPRIRDFEADDAFVLGLNGQVYVSRSVSLLAEWIVSEERPEQWYDSGTFGVEIRTRGHFFKIFVTNQVRMNPTQVLGGSFDAFTADELRLGFNITRRLVF